MKDKLRILIAYDGSLDAESAIYNLRHAGLPRDVCALIVSVKERPLPEGLNIYEVARLEFASRRITSALALSDPEARLSTTETQKLAASGAQLVRSIFPAWATYWEVAEGAPADGLIQKAKDWKADLLIVGNRDQDHASLSKKIALDAPCSVRIVRRTSIRSKVEPPRLMIGVDGSPGSQTAISTLRRRLWADGTQARLIVVPHAPDPARLGADSPLMAILRTKQATRALMAAEWGAQELRSLGINSSIEILAGDPIEILLEQAARWKADSLFIGANGETRAGHKAGLGKVSRGLIEAAACTLEIVR